MALADRQLRRKEFGHCLVRLYKQLQIAVPTVPGAGSRACWGPRMYLHRANGPLPMATEAALVQALKGVHYARTVRAVL